MHLHKVQDRILQVSWSPHNAKCLLLLTEVSELKQINVETGQVDNFELLKNVTAAKWHPRQANLVLIGSGKGRLAIFNTETRKIVTEYEVPNDLKPED